MGDTDILSVRIPYRTYPLKRPVVGLPGITETWCPVLNVAIIVGDATSKKFEAVVDSGSAVCLFHADIGKALGMKLGEGEKDQLGGVVGGSKGDVWYHKVKLKLLAEVIPITAGFSENLAVAAILGRHGFFEHFTITFDPCNNPPGLNLERFHRA
jgi:hypothetical protein